MEIIHACEIKNDDTEKKIEEAIEWNMKEAKRLAEKGFAKCCLSTGRLGVEYEEIIMNKLKKYGYREWNHPVYVGGWLQRSKYFTWRIDA